MKSKLDRSYRQNIDYRNRWPTQETLVEPIFTSGDGSLPLTLKRTRTLEALTVPLQWVADGIGHLQNGITHYSEAIEEKYQRRWAESTSSSHLDKSILKLQRTKPGMSKHPYDTGIDAAFSMENSAKPRGKDIPETQATPGGAVSTSKLSKDQHMDEARGRSLVYEVWESRSGPLESYGVAPLPKKKLRFRDRVRASLPLSTSAGSDVKKKGPDSGHDAEAPLLASNYDSGDNNDRKGRPVPKSDYTTTEEGSNGRTESDEQSSDSSHEPWKSTKDRRASTYPRTEETMSPPDKGDAISQKPSRKRKVDFQTPESKRHQPGEAAAMSSNCEASRPKKKPGRGTGKPQRSTETNGPDPKNTTNEASLATNAQIEKKEPEKGRIQFRVNHFIARFTRRPFATSKSLETVVEPPRDKTPSRSANEGYGLDGHGYDGIDSAQRRNGPYSWASFSRPRASSTSRPSWRGLPKATGSSRVRNRNPASCPMCGHRANLSASPPMEQHSRKMHNRNSSPGYPYLIF